MLMLPHKTSKLKREFFVRYRRLFALNVLVVLVLVAVLLALVLR